MLSMRFMALRASISTVGPAHTSGDAVRSVTILDGKA